MKLEITNSETHIYRNGYCYVCGVKWGEGAVHTTADGKEFVQPKYDPLKAGTILSP